MYINKDVTPQVAARQRIERTIVRRVVKDALAAGYRLSVDIGDEELLAENVTTYKAAIAALMETDEDYLILQRGPEYNEEGGWVRFVYGNGGWDVIADYTVNLEGLLAPALALAEKLEARTSR